MVKVSVITLHAVHNYGSALQAYATQEIFRHMGLDVEIVDYRREAILRSSVINILNSNKLSLYMKMKLLIILPSEKKAEKVFAKFLSTRLEMTDKRYTYDEDFQKWPINADVYCTGSDQVWNSDWHEEVVKPFFLSYAPENKLKIAFSASFGKSELADWEKGTIRELLNRYNAISVREKSGLAILQDLGIDCGELVLDPTQIVAPKVWYNLASSQIIHKGYILVYQLCNNKAFDKAAVAFAKRKGLKLIRLCIRYDQLRKPGSGVVLPAVEEFLSLFRDAEYVLTDSFHATSFSLIFHKKFVCFHPNRFSTRLESILQIVGLCNHLMEDGVLDDVIEERIDYKHVDEVLNKYRENGLSFLRKAIGDNG